MCRGLGRVRRALSPRGTDVGVKRPKGGRRASTRQGAGGGSMGALWGVAITWAQGSLWR